MIFSTIYLSLFFTWLFSTCCSLFELGPYHVSIYNSLFEFEFQTSRIIISECIYVQIIYHGLLRRIIVLDLYKLLAAINIVLDFVLCSFLCWSQYLGMSYYQVYPLLANSDSLSTHHKESFDHIFSI